MTPEHKFTLLTTFGPASIAAVVAWLVARYTVKHGPDYQKQMNDLRSEMGRISTAQEGMLAHQKQITADEQSRREAAQWRPEMVLVADAHTMTNHLSIRSDKHFSIETVRITTESGAVVGTFRGDISQAVQMAEFPIPYNAINDLTLRDPAYLNGDKTVGGIECALLVGARGQRMSFNFRFRAIREVSTAENRKTIWCRLDGSL